VINVAGHRLSTGQLEEVIASHNDIAECAVVGLADQLKGQIPIGFAVLKAGVDRPAENIAAELIALVRERVGPVASLKTVAIVDALPKTRSGKTLRATIRKIADGEQWTVPPTIEDATVLDDYAELLPRLGYGTPKMIQAQLIAKRHLASERLERPRAPSGLNNGRLAEHHIETKRRA
jgi:propionyl-CoA synthetase